MSLQDFFATVGPVFAGTATIEALVASQGESGPAWNRALTFYERTCRRRRAEALSAAFPDAAGAARALLEERGWTRLVDAYFSASPMTHWGVTQNGAGFPAFLERESAEGRVPPWLAELADLEWWEWRTSVAPDSPADLPLDEGPLRLASTVELRQYHHDLCAWLDEGAAERRTTTPPLHDTVVVFWRDRDGHAFRNKITDAELTALREVDRSLVRPASDRLSAAVEAALAGLREADIVLGFHAIPTMPPPELAPAEPDPPPTSRLDPYALLLQMSQLLLAEDRLEMVPDLFLRRVVELTDATDGMLLVRQGDTFASTVEISDLEREIPEPLRRARRALARYAIDVRETVTTADAGADPRLLDIAGIPELGGRAALAVPLSQSGDVQGAVYVDRPSAIGFSREAISLLNDVGELTAMFLRRLAEREALRRRGRLDLDNTQRDFAGIVTQDPRMWELLRLVGQVADSDATVLIGGETGTGKELIARALHDHSPRRNKPLVTLHCTALPATVLESELFGHVRGAFTGADRDRAGRIATAHGGTLMLDEVAEIPPELQAKLLRFLQFGEIQRLGSDRTEKVDVRVLAASHQDLRALVEKGRFRQDLYYRLKVIELRIPPLRERRADIPLLIDLFLKRHWKRSTETGRFTPRALAALSDHAWPGNVRELEHAIERACVMAAGPDLDVDLLPKDLFERRSSKPPIVAGRTGPPPPANQRFTSDELEAVREAAVAGAERRFLVGLMERYGGNISQASRESGIHRSYLQRLMSRHGLRDRE